MSVREYVGARYVPLFAEPAQWSDTRTYEPLTIVMNEGNSYTSRQYVPLGIPLTDENYWALTGNYNAQVEAYRQEVKRLADEMAVLSKKTNYTTPEMYGAKGDGVADDTFFIQKAIDEAARLGYNCVYLSGNYLVTSELKVPYNEFSIIGFSKNEYSPSLKSAFNGFSSIINISGYGFNIQNVVFTNINGTTENQNRTGVGLKFLRVTSDLDFEIRSCAFFYLNKGVSFVGGSTIISDCIFVYCNYGIYEELNELTLHSGHYWFDNKFHNIGLSGSTSSEECSCIFLQDAKIPEANGVIDNCLVQHSSHFIVGNLMGFSVKNNHISANYYSAIKATNGYEVDKNQVSTFISNNYFRNLFSATYSPLSIIDVSNMSNVVVSNNSFNYCKSYAVKFVNCQWVVVNNNYFNYAPFKTTEPIAGTIVFSNCTNNNVNGNVSKSSYTQNTPDVDYAVNCDTSAYIGTNNFDCVNVTNGAYLISSKDTVIVKNASIQPLPISVKRVVNAQSLVVVLSGTVSGSVQISGNSVAKSGVGYTAENELIGVKIVFSNDYTTITGLSITKYTLSGGNITPVNVSDCNITINVIP